MEREQKTGAVPGRKGNSEQERPGRLAAGGLEQSRQPGNYAAFARRFRAEVRDFAELLTEEISEGSGLVTPASAAYYRNRFCLLFTGEAERLADIYMLYEPRAGRRLFCRTWMERLAVVPDCYPAQLLEQRRSGSGWGEAEDFQRWLDSFRRKEGPDARKLADAIICKSDEFLTAMEPGLARTKADGYNLA